MAEQEESNLRVLHHAGVIAVTAATYGVIVYLNVEPSILLQLSHVPYSEPSLLSAHELRRWGLMYEKSQILRQQLDQVPISVLRQHYEPMDDFIASCDFFFEESAKLILEESTNVNQARPFEPAWKASHDKEETGHLRWFSLENIASIRLAYKVAAENIRVTRLAVMLYRDSMPSATLPNWIDFANSLPLSEDRDSMTSATLPKLIDFTTSPPLSEDVIRERQHKLAQANRVIQQLHQAPLALLRRQRQQFDRFIVDCQLFFGRSRTLLSGTLPGASQAPPLHV